MLKPDEEMNANWSPNANCGARDCPASGSQETVSLRKPQMSTVYLLCTIYVGLGVMSVVLVKSMLREYPNAVASTILADSSRSGRFDLLVSTITHMRDKKQILIVPVTLWMGFSLAFMGADFTKSFVACTRG